MKKLLFLCLLAFSGCITTATDAKNANEASFKSPQFVGEVNGQKIYHCEAWVKSGDSYQRQHIYFVGDVVTVNDPQPKRSDEITVMINGVQYIPDNSEAQAETLK